MSVPKGCYIHIFTDEHVTEAKRVFVDNELSPTIKFVPGESWKHFVISSGANDGDSREEMEQLLKLLAHGVSQGVEKGQFGG